MPSWGLCRIMQGSIGCGTRRGVILLLGTAKTGSVSVGRHHCRAIPSGATAVADVASDVEFDDEARGQPLAAEHPWSAGRSHPVAAEHPWSAGNC